MKGKNTFTKEDANRIRALLVKKLRTASGDQKAVRDELRSVGFYITDFHHPARPFGPQHFDELVAGGQIAIMGNAPDRTLQSAPAAESAPRQRRKSSPTPPRTRSTSDESYVLDLCDEVLGLTAERQKRFPFLIGDAGTALPVDAYYPHIKLVVEYRERQHTEDVEFFNKRQTRSGVDRETQRRIYDQRRRDVLPQHDIVLVELSFDMFGHDGRKRLRRNRASDLVVVGKALSKWTG